ncbi:probable LRR receptor-like serine/threonine-protein kinase At1g07650 [Helianthus annuus]|uniref:probable LRR receptor-like serine/threonine-protein kinase At1g07650 n=1 Tax=Helianthus annuus TaxID=4232 RepID=UPI000B8EF575|nr:probable LRR receptor-like serine/threonine-protein kinase At1g07650 [Helianthus annuus]
MNGKVVPGPELKGAETVETMLVGAVVCVLTAVNPEFIEPEAAIDQIVAQEIHQSGGFKTGACKWRVWILYSSWKFYMQNSKPLGSPQRWEGSSATTLWREDKYGDLSSNDFTGQLPAALAKLTNLANVRIRDNNFTGKIPNFISQWKQIRKLHIQGCSFEGPLPSSISFLTKLEDLRISDLKGEASTIPSLEQMIRLDILILRNCLIYGTIPNYFGDFMLLTTLDLSFNNLTGGIPSSFSKLEAEHVYLTKNNLTGPVPAWVYSSTKDVDISCNHFTWDPSGPRICEQEKINVVESYSSSSTDKQYNIQPCLRKDFPCIKSDVKKIYSLRINCGGKEVYINNTKYESDTEKKGASPYYNAGNWAFSSTGNFLDDDRDSDIYILSNTSSLHNTSTFDTDLYTTARTTAISLTYYGLCLINGNYTVMLHFAEIVFTQYNSFNTLGRRVFDVYVQGELKLKDFNIENEAGGVGMTVIKRFTVNVKNNTLKIQLYWAGKGTTNIPKKGTYGPIISAISIDPDFEPPKDEKKMEVGLIVGTVGGGLFFVLLIIVILWRKGYIMGKKTEERGKTFNFDSNDRNIFCLAELRGIDLQTGIFTLRQIKAATKNFDPSNKLGEGGFGVVYKGLLSDGTIIAVKQLSSKSKQGAREFVNEIGMMSAIRHPNLVRLYGCCVEENQMSLIYEYMENNCLSRALLGTDKVLKAKLTWNVRLSICIGIARGLAYLHEESHMRIIHRDVKASNVLLDENFNAKISDFGLAKLNDDANTHINTRVVGTMGYMAPEYAMRGHLTTKADVYSFGILALEIVSGISCNKSFSYETEECLYLFDWVWLLHEKETLLELVDPDLGSEYSSEEALTIIQVALLCTKGSFRRPTMSQTLNVLEGRTNIQDLEKELLSSTMHHPDNKPLIKQLWPDYSEIRPTRGEPHTESFITESFVTESFITESS